MDVKKIVLLIGALVIAAVTAITAKNMFTGASAPQAQAAPAAPVEAAPEVLVATRPLPVGTILDPEAFRFQPWPEGLVQPAYFIKDDGTTDANSLVGSVVRTELTAGQPLTQGTLIKPGERGFLAAALSPGMRAISVPVSGSANVAAVGFVFPGDRVDIMLTQTVAGGDGPPLQVTETILRNVRVLAVDTRTSAVNAEGKAEVRGGAMVTLEVTPKIAEKLTVAQPIGALTMALRPLADNDAELERAIARGEVSLPEGADPKAERRALIQIAGKPIEAGTTFTVGGDVSRYQRKSVPTKTKGPNGEPIDGIAAGPVVRVARGNSVTIVPLGAK